MRQVRFQKSDSVSMAQKMSKTVSDVWTNPTHLPKRSRVVGLLRSGSVLSRALIKPRVFGSLQNKSAAVSLPALLPNYISDFIFVLFNSAGIFLYSVHLSSPDRVYVWKAIGFDGPAICEDGVRICSELCCSIFAINLFASCYHQEPLSLLRVEKLQPLVRTRTRPILKTPYPLGFGDEVIVVFGNTNDSNCNM